MRFLLYPLLLLFFFCIFKNSEAFKFLLISPIYSYSHIKFMSNIADTLSSHGHEVVVLQPQLLEAFRSKKVIKDQRVKIINYENSDEGKAFYATRPKSTVAKFWTENQAATPWKASQFSDTMSKDLEHMCIKIFQDTKLHEQLKSENFDVLIAEPFDPCGLYLSEILNIPSTIVAMASSRTDPVQWAIGQPSSVNFVPGPNSRYGKDSGIFDRLNNLYSYYTRRTMMRGVYSNIHQKIQKVYTEKPIRHLDEIIADSAFLFFNSNPLLDFPFPSITKYVPIGGFSMNISSWKADGLPKDLNKILSLRSKTVLVSFGSVIRSADMPVHYLNALINAFKSMPEVTFIWKFEEDFLLQLPPNVFLQKWLPQPSLLADPRLSLFVTHGGLGSVMEVSYAGKPAIVVPLFFDQPMNGEMLARHGSAEVYSKFDLADGQKFQSLVKKILEDSGYQKNAIRLSNLLRKQPIDPVERLVKHAEFAAEFHRFPELDPHSRHLNFFEFYFLDIIIISLAIIYTVFKILQLILRAGMRMARLSTREQKKEKIG